MRINSLLGLAAVAGAAYFLKSEKGKSFVNQYSGQFDEWVSQGKQALQNVANKVNNTSMKNPV